MTQFSSDKIFKHLDRILEWKSTGLSRPVTYELDMTNVCNSKCPFCFGFYGREKDYSSMSREDVKSILIQIKKFGGKGVTFTGGGEPLCNKYSVEAVRLARESGLDVGFITNGLLLTPQIAETLVKHCTWIRISMDAGSNETYQRTHGLNSTSFQSVIEKTTMLVDMKVKHNPGVTIGTGFLTFPEVVNDMRKYAELCSSIGVDYAQFRPLLKKYTQKEINDNADDKLLSTLEECSRLSTDKFNVLCSIHKYKLMKNGGTKRNYNKCYGHNFAAVIAANKKMYLCCHMRGVEKYCIGDLEKNTLKEIWESDMRKKAYDSIEFNDCPLLCRCDGINTLLWNITQEKAHENFL